MSFQSCWRGHDRRYSWQNAFYSCSIIFKIDPRIVRKVEKVYFFFRRKKRYVCSDRLPTEVEFFRTCVSFSSTTRLFLKKSVAFLLHVLNQWSHYSQSSSASSLVFNIDFSPSCLFITQSINIVFLLDRLTTAGEFGVFLLQLAFKSHLLVTFSRLTFNRILNLLPHL